MEFISLILVTNKDKAAEARKLPANFGRWKSEIKRFFNWGIG